MQKGNFTFIFKANSENSFSFICRYNVVLKNLFNVINIYRITINVNDIIVFDGSELSEVIAFNANDNINITVYRYDNNFDGKFQLN